MSDSAPLPPVRLHSEAELARDALTAPLLVRAVRLARWAGPGTRVGAGGELVDEQLPAAAAELGLTGGTEGPGGAGESDRDAAGKAAGVVGTVDGVDAADAAALASEAWRVAVDIGLVEVDEAEENERDEENGGNGGNDEGTVRPGEELARLAGGSPTDVLGLWLGALDTVIADASVPDLDDLVEAVGVGGTIDFDRLDWDPEAEADFLDSVLGNLYLLSVSEDAPPDGRVPLPALAASVIVPEDMAEPTDAVLEQVSDAMMRLDDQFRMLEPIGFVAYEPVDEALMADASDEGAVADDTDVTRYGMVRLTPLGRYGLRERLIDAGFEAPAVGELADKGADTLLDGTASFPQAAAQAEIEQWTARREPLAAARELLAAARGGDAGAPLRRLRCQQALSLAGREAEPALREVLGDAELGGLARVWLAEHGLTDVPPPTEDMVFWLTVDTLAAQLAVEGNSTELQSLVEGLARQHQGFFDRAWRVGHPATADVLDAMGRLHPDKGVAKEARKAAFKARSQRGG